MSTYPEEGFSSSKKEGRIGITDAEELTSEPESSNDPSTWNSRFLDAVEKFWLFEFFGWTLALGSLMGIVALLVVYDGEESPNWTLKVGAGRHRKTLGLTINTIISIFATAFNSGLLIPVAASMSQLKWVWFQKGGRPLAHYQSFDSAARGPLGSVVLLWTLRCRYAARILLSVSDIVLTRQTSCLPRSSNHHRGPGYWLLFPGFGRLPSSTSPGGRGEDFENQLQPGKRSRYVSRPLSLLPRD